LRSKVHELRAERPDLRIARETAQMIKDLVVNLPVGHRPIAAADYAISIAEAFGAHVSGIAFAY
jgi:hypothetical protein